METKINWEKYRKIFIVIFFALLCYGAVLQNILFAPKINKATDYKSVYITYEVRYKGYKNFNGYNNGYMKITDRKIVDSLIGLKNNLVKTCRIFGDYKFPYKINIYYQESPTSSDEYISLLYEPGHKHLFVKWGKFAQGEYRNPYFYKYVLELINKNEEINFNN